MLRAWLARLSAGPLRPATVHQVYRALRRTLASAVENDVIVRNPLEGIKPPRVEPQEMRFLTPVEIATLADTIDERYRAFVMIGAYGGLRLGEMAGLRRHRVDLLHRRIQVVEQLGRNAAGHWILQPLKTRASRRSVALPGAVLDTVDEHLRRWAGRGDDGFVFTAPDGGHLDPDNFRSRIWTPAVAAAGVAPLRIHDLRHTTASLAIAAGADVKTLQTMLGHASAVMTLDRYGPPHARHRRGRRGPSRRSCSHRRARADSCCRAAGRGGIFAGWRLSRPRASGQKSPADLDFYRWSSPASIRGPSAFQADALPTELLDRAPARRPVPAWWDGGPDGT